MWNLGNVMILAGSLLSQSALSEPLPPSPPPSKIDTLRNTISLQMTASITPEDSENIAFIGRPVTIQSSAQWVELDYLKNVQKFQIGLAQRVSLTLGDFQIWFSKGDRNFDVGKGIGLRYKIPTQNFISGSTGGIEAGVGRDGLFIKFKAVY